MAPRSGATLAVPVLTRGFQWGASSAAEFQFEGAFKVQPSFNGGGCNVVVSMW